MRYFCVAVVSTVIGISIFLLLSPDTFARKYPSIPFTVTGEVIDWETKKPVAGVTLIVFLNDAAYSANDGWNGEYDYPNLPRTDREGQFEARTMLYRSSRGDKPKLMEIIVLCTGYRTERFEFKNPSYSLSPDKKSGLITGILLEIFRTKRGQ